MFAKLEGLEKKYMELEQALAQPDVYNDQDQYRKLTKAHADLRDVVELFRRCVPLRQIADSKGGNGREDGEGCPQPFAVQTAFQHEHGASAHIAVLVLHPVFDGE